MASRLTIEISPEAKQDIREAVHWIAKDNQLAALAFLDAIAGVIEDIPSFPGQHPLAPETKLGFTDAVVHQLLFGKRTKYRILFTTVAKTITVIRVLHGARKFLGQTFPEDEI